jgi:apolipoprotein N-acyltransferase
LITGNPWGLIGYSQAGVLPVIQIADVTGVYGVGFVLVASNAALAELWCAWRAGTVLGPSLRGLVVAVTAIVLVIAYGGVRLSDSARGVSGAPVTVGLVQGNLDLGAQWREELYGRNLDVYMRLTASLLRESRPAVVFWPENALSFFLADEHLYRTAIGRVLSPSGAQLVTGGPRIDGTDDRRYFNSVHLLSPDGGIVAWYDKQKLVPFAEYFPFAQLDVLRRRFGRIREFTPGAAEPLQLLPTAAGPAGVTICNEAMFPDVAAARVRAGAVYLVDPANDTWLSPKFSAQQFEIVTFRTIELRRYLVRASTSGPSAIVDPHGRVTLRTETFTRTAVAGSIWPVTTLTPYCRVGDLFAILCTVAALTAWLRRRAGAAR